MLRRSKEPAAEMPSTRLICLADSEADIYEYLAEAQARLVCKRERGGGAGRSGPAQLPNLTSARRVVARNHPTNSVVKLEFRR